MSRRNFARAVAVAIATMLGLTLIPAAGAAVRCFGAAPTIVGGAGNNRIVGTAGDDVIVAGGGNDRVFARGGDDRVCGGRGDDLLVGFGGRDRVDGDAGNDVLVGQRASDLLRGGRGNDVLYGLGGRDRLRGGGGGDGIFGGDGNDAVDGQGAFDFAVFRFSRRGVEANLTAGTARGEGADTLRRIEGLGGSRKNDRLIGDAARNVFLGFAGSDVLDGRAGPDLASFEAAASGVVVDLLLDSATGEGSDTLTGIEDVTGSAHDDTVSGDNSPNFFFGLRGDDTLSGLGADDFLNGLGGHDTGDGGPDGPNGDTCVEIETEVNCELGASAAVSVSAPSSLTRMPWRGIFRAYRP